MNLVAYRYADLSLYNGSQGLMGGVEQNYSWKNRKSAVLHVWKQDDLAAWIYKENPEKTGVSLETIQRTASVMCREL